MLYIININWKIKYLQHMYLYYFNYEVLKNQFLISVNGIPNIYII